MAGSGGGGAFTPTSVSGCTLWLRADLGVTTATGVSAWNDQSGSGNHWTQASGAGQPLLVASAVNGQPGVQFDGVAHFMSGPAALSSLITATAYTMFAVVKFISAAAASGTSYLENPLVAEVGSYHGVFFDNGAAVKLENFAAVEAHDDLTITLGTVYTFKGRHDSGNLVTSLNGAADSAGTAAGNTGSLAGQVNMGKSGSAIFGNFLLCELIYYNNVIGGTNEGLVKTYLQGRYAHY